MSETTSEPLPFLYHYQRFERDHLIDLLQKQRLFCSDPSKLNDPWDCKPSFDSRPMLEDRVKREQMIAFLQNALPQGTFDHPYRDTYEDLLRTSDSALKKAVEVMSKLLIERLRERRIYCLTPLAGSALMWSHYAASHQGICLEFDANSELMRRAKPVVYSTSYPEWTPHECDPLELVLTKSTDWAYERELRIIDGPHNRASKSHDGFLELPPGALTAIIVGCNCSRQDHDDILSILKDHAPSLRVRRAVRSPNQYKLTIQG